MPSLPLKSMLSVLVLVATSVGTAANDSGPSRPAKPDRFTDPHLVMAVDVRTPDQLAAFYTGRGFNAAAIAAITQTCFISAFIENRDYAALWLVPDEWRFETSAGEPISRIRRDAWAAVWQQAGLPQAQQSTFGWTQLPESRDLRAHEHAGGNVVIPWQDQPFTLTANFRTGADGNGPVRTIVFRDLRCRRD